MQWVASAAGTGPIAMAARAQAGLKPGKPLAGATVNVLTVVAPQFSAHEAKLAEFEALTGIKVKYQYVPFASMREKLTAELVAQTDQYDVLSVMDVWGSEHQQLWETCVTVPCGFCWLNRLRVSGHGQSRPV